MPKKGLPTMVIVNKSANMQVPDLPDLGDLSEDFDKPSSSGPNFASNSGLMQLFVPSAEPSTIDEALRNLLSQKDRSSEEIMENDFNFDIQLPEISVSEQTIAPRPISLPRQHPRTARTNRNYSYRSEYDTLFPGIQRSRKGNEYYYCSVCDLDFILGRNGPRAIRQHVKSKKHVQIQNVNENKDSPDRITENPDEIPPPKIKKSKTALVNTASYTIYRQEYGNQFHGITESIRGNTWFYCTFCEKDLLFGKDGVKAIQRHVTSQKHMNRDDRPELCASINFKCFTFRQEYITKFSGIQPSLKGESYFYCIVCQKDLMLARSGSKAIGLHLLSAKHMEIEEEKAKRDSFLEAGSSSMQENG